MRNQYIPFGLSATTFNRILSRIDRSGGPDACWPWTGVTNRKGYGTVHTPSQITGLAHRIILASSIGRDLRPDEVTMHDCDNPPCCNPRHLSPGSNLANMRQAYERGRFANRLPQKPPVFLGESHPHARLTVEQVREIRLRYAAGGTSQQSLGDEYGVSQAVISAIVRRKTWRHVQ